MGSSASTPIPLTSSSEKYTSNAEAVSATEALHKLSLRSSSYNNNNKIATAALTIDSIKQWDQKLQGIPVAKLAAVVLSKSDFSVALTSRKAVIADNQVFNVKIAQENTLVANQKSSGRCWLFATTNILRNATSSKHDLEDFEFSQSYLYFYDTLSKANYFLENMLDLATEPLDSREMMYLSSCVRNDGGQISMAMNIIEKFGLVPQSVFPESFSSSATGRLNILLSAKLREYALELRRLHASAMRSLNEVEGKCFAEKKALASKSARGRKEEQMEEVYRILATTLGSPPKPDESFTYEYTTLVGKKFKSVTHTPLSFYHSFCPVDVSGYISLINDPRNPMDTLYTVQRLGNVVGGRPVLYVNTEIDILKNVAIDLLQRNIPVWFGCDVGKDSSSALGVMDTKLFDLEGAFGTAPRMNKEERLRTGDSSMTHAMTLTAVHLDANGRPVRWRVENSWGALACTKGYMLMTDDWFTEHVFQVVADRSRIPANLVKIFDSDKPVELLPWDAMGSLA